MVPDALSGGPYFSAFCERYIRHTKGRWAKQPLVFEDWQREFWWEALELDPVTGLRVYSEVGLGIPRKNGKSTMASAGGLYFLTADGEAEPEVYAAAAARNQAGIVLGQSRRMANASPRILDRVKVLRYSIECPRNGGIMRSLSSDAALQHGLNPSANIVDELHAHRNADLYTALTTGTGAREQPFTMWISTAGIAGQGILGDFYQSMFDGPGELERRGSSLLIYRDRTNGVLIYWYGAPRDADIEDPAVWAACNPASWMQAGRYLSRQFATLKSRGSLLEFRMYHLNQFGEHEESWLPEGAWEACSDGFQLSDGVTVFEHPLNPELPVGIGVDKAQTSDLAAVVVAQRQGERVVIRSRVFPPDSVTGRVNGAEIRAYVDTLRSTYPAAMARDPDTKRPLPGPAVAFDNVSFDESAEILDGAGVNMVRFPNTDTYMAPASTQAFELITNRRIVHDGDLVLAEHFGATGAKVTERGVRITKVRAGSARKNVAAFASVMAIAMAMQEAPAPFIKRRQVLAAF